MLRRSLRALLVSFAAAIFGIVAVSGAEADRGSPPVEPPEVRLQLRFPGPERYGNQPLDAKLARFGPVPAIRPTWMHDFSRGPVGGTAGLREMHWPWPIRSA